MSFKRILKSYLSDVPEPVVIKNKVSGTINEADTEDKTIWAYDRNTGELLGSTIVDRDTRTWALYLDPEHNDESITLICRDEGGNYNGDIFDRVSLCATEYPYPSGIMGKLMYPETNLADSFVATGYFNKYCTVTVPELKGDVVKVVQDGAQVDKAYPVKFVNAGGSEIINNVTSNNVIVNNDSVVLDKITRAPNLVKWRKDIFNDGSEIFHPVWDGKSWKNVYSGFPFGVPGNEAPHSDVDNTFTIGKFKEAAIRVGDRHGTLALKGPECYIDTTGVSAMSVSFWYRCNNATNSDNSGENTHRAVYTVLHMLDIKNDKSIFNLGSELERYNGTGPSYADYVLFYVGINNSFLLKRPTGFNFADWHHYTIVFTPTATNFYIDKELAHTIEFPSHTLGDSCSMVLGKNNQYTNYSDRQQVGEYSGLRIFKKAITAPEIEILYNDVPLVETDVSSIKGMEHDNGLICLGGIPYTPLNSSVEYKTAVCDDGTTKYIVLKNWDKEHVTNSFSVDMRSDYVYFWGYSSTAGRYTGLSSRPDANAEQDMGVNLNNIDVYMRVYLINTGYVLKLGNKTNSVIFYWYNGTNGMYVRFRNQAGTNVQISTKLITSPPNRWLRIKWIQNKIYFYEDDGTTLLHEYTIPNFSMISETKGQISVGCCRGGSMGDTGGTDVYGGVCRISDVHIYEKGKMGIDEPIKKYEFGYDRGLYGGLYLWGTHAGSVSAYNGDIEELNKDSVVVGAKYTARDVSLSDWFTPSGYTVLLNYAIAYRNENNNRWPFSVSQIWGLGVLYQMERIGADVYGHGLNPPTATNLLNETRDHNVIFNEWTHFGFICDYKNSVICQYSQGIPVHGYYVHQYPPELSSEPLNMNYYANTKLAFSNTYIYPTVLPLTSIRNAVQNYKGKCYKDEMLVAFVEENTPYPVYANTPLLNIKVQGNDNGQVLTFACTKDNVNYYVYTTEWKKILTKEGDFWMYWDGSIWQNGGTVKWKAASLAMDIPANRMTLQKINSLSSVQLNTLHDLSVGTFNLAVGMKSDGTKSPYIDGVMYNNEKVWMSPVYTLDDFENTSYITKVHLSKILVERKTDGLKVFVHRSGELGWTECQNFGAVPGIIQNANNTGTVQFKITADQSKDNKDETALFEVTIK